MRLFSADKFLKFDIQLNCVLTGFAAESCNAEGRAIKVIRREFTSSEDGDLFIRRLQESLSRVILNTIRKQQKVIVVESSIANMLAIVRRDRTATVYINAPMKALMQTKKSSVSAGEAIYLDDIADVSELVFHDIEIPDDVGVMVLFSVGWRKGLFYDLVPLSGDDEKRDYDLNQLLGGYYAYLSFQERLAISDSQWDSLLDNGWFPFITLKKDMIDNILAQNREGWNVDDLIEKIRGEVSQRLPGGLKAWANVKAFEPHMEFISKAVEHYESNDYLI